MSVLFSTLPLKQIPIVSGTRCLSKLSTVTAVCEGSGLVCLIGLGWVGTCVLGEWAG